MSDTVAIFHTSRFNFLRFLEIIATFAVAAIACDEASGRFLHSVPCNIPTSLAIICSHMTSSTHLAHLFPVPHLPP